MKLLVTGGLGFIGTNFIIHILNNYQEHSIVNIDAELIGSNHKSLSNFENSNNYKFVKGNITDRVLMEKLINECDAIINFVALTNLSNPNLCA